MNSLDKFFKLSSHGTNAKTEAVSGVATFLALAYIIPVNTSIMSATGMPEAGVFLGTILSTVIATLIMGLYANYPVVLIPGMGLNAFFAYTVVLYGYGFTWQQGLACVFVSGIIFLLLSATKVRSYIIDSIPLDLKHAVSVGIGFFIAFLGLKNAGFIVFDQATYVTLGEFSNPTVLLAVFCLFAILVFHIRGNNLAIIIGLTATTVIGLILYYLGVEGMPHYESGSSFKDFAAINDMLFAFVPHVKEVITSKEGWFAIFTFLFIDFFDTAGTLIAVGTDANLVDEKGNLQDGNKALMSDSIGTVVGSFLGMAPVTSAIESLVGIKMGGRTGLMAVVAALLFLVSIVLYPLLSVVNGVFLPEYAGATDVVLSPITAPILIYIGSLMVSNLRHINWSSEVATISAFFTIIFMPLAFSIADGIAIGVIVYSVLTIAKGESKDLHIVMKILSVLFALYFLFV